MLTRSLNRAFFIVQGGYREEVKRWGNTSQKLGGKRRKRYAEEMDINVSCVDATEKSLLVIPSIISIQRKNTLSYSGMNRISSPYVPRVTRKCTREKQEGLLKRENGSNNG